MQALAINLLTNKKLRGCGLVNKIRMLPISRS